MGARTVREWARVGRALAELPLLRRAVVSGEVSWTVARMVVAHTTPQNEQAVLATVRGRTVRAFEVLLRAAFPREPKVTSDDERVAVSVSCSAELSTRWVAALELARRVAGEELPTWECAEAIAAECASALPVDESTCSRTTRRRGKSARRAGGESGFRALVWPHLRWRGAAARANAQLERLARELDTCSPRQLDRRFRQVTAFLQQVDFEIGRVLRQVLERRLYLELGFESFERYVTERLDLSSSTAGRLVRLARAAGRSA